jgi:hypothetical protein
MIWFALDDDQCGSKNTGSLGLVMSLLRTIAVGTVGLILSGMALTAHAADAPRGKATVTTEVALGTDAFAKDQNQWGAQSTRRSLQWDDKARWGVKLDLTQPSSRDMQLKDIQAGAYYRLSPSLRVGGAVALGDSAQLNRYTVPQDRAPRVRLETAFKF